MKNKKKSSSHIFLLVILLAVLLLLILIIGKKALEQRRNSRLLRQSTYNSAFLSMFPIDSFNEEDFLYYREDELLKFTPVIANYTTLHKYAKDIQSSGNRIRSLYLGIDPTRVTAAQILALRDMFPDTLIEVIPSYRPLSLWKKDKKSDATLKAYWDLVNQLVDQERICVYSFFTQEWLIADDTNYDSGLLLNAATAKLLYIYMDRVHHCNFTRENMTTCFQDLTTLLDTVKAGEYQFPDLSSWRLLFFGDSIFGNYTDHHSIPELVSYFSSAECFNCGWGGATASGSLPSGGIQMLNAYLKKDLSALPEESQAYKGIQALLKAEKEEAPKNTLFLLHYCLNDYFCGKPLKSEDPYDPETYCGAMRTMIENIRAQYPNARILLVLPNAITCYDSGNQTLEDTGAPLSEYRNALKAIAEEYSLPCQDNLLDAIPQAGAARFLDGEIHPNEYGRYLIAKALTQTIYASFE